MTDDRLGHGCVKVSCWSLLVGIGAAACFAVGLIAYSELWTDGEFLNGPNAHGAFGPTTGSLVLILGTPVVLLVGMVIGFVIGANRADRK